MILTRGKIVIISITIGIVAGLVALVQLTVVEFEELGPQVTIIMENVKMKKIDEQENVMIVAVAFGIFNSADKTLTISKIDYELFANERLLGRGFLSLEDIPLTGRPSIFPTSNTTIPTEFRLGFSQDVKDIWDILAAGGDVSEEDGQISWRATGNAEIETAFSIIPVEFETSL